MRYRDIEELELGRASGVDARDISYRLNAAALKYSGEDALPKIARALGVRVQWLETGENPPSWLDKVPPEPEQPDRLGPAFEYLEWEARLTDAWEDFVTKQIDPSHDELLQNLSETWQDVPAVVAMPTGWKHLSPERVAVVAEQFGLARTADDIIAGRDAVAAQRPWRQGTIAPWTLDSAALRRVLGEAIDLALRRPKRFDGQTATEIREALNRVQTDGDLFAAMNTARPSMPPQTFAVLFEALIGLRDNRVEKQKPWADIAETTKRLFNAPPPSTVPQSLIDWVKLHRRMFTGQALVPIPHDDDRRQGHRLREVRSVFVPRIVRLQEVEQVYEARGFSGAASGDLKQLIARGLVRRLRNKYLLWPGDDELSKRAKTG